MSAQRRVSALRRALLLLSCLAVLAAAAWASPVASAPPAGPSAAAAPTQAAKAVPTAKPAATVKEVAAEITSKMGTVGPLVNGKPGGSIFVFEETHVSPAGQTEIAIMLNRLYERYGLRTIGLEGAWAKDKPIDASAYHIAPGFHAGDRVHSREDVLAQMLEQGELSSAEFMAAIYDDAKVYGIELESEHPRTISDEASISHVVYLYQIALATLSDSEAEAALGLINAGKTDEAIDYIINSDPFTKEMYARLIDPDTMYSPEEMVELIDEISAKSAEVGAEITDEDEANLAELRDFYYQRYLASATMVANAIRLAKQSPAAPVAITVGAAHRARMEELLRQAKVPFVFIQPNSFVKGLEKGDLSTAAFDRKAMGQSVDLANQLGAMLDGRNKPSPTITQPWEKSKTQIWLVADVLAAAAAGKEPAPFDATLKSLAPALTNVTIVPGSVRIVDGDVIFAVKAQKNPSGTQEIWVRTRVNKALAQQMLLEELLKDHLGRVQAKVEPVEEADENATGPKTVRISSDTIAAFATSEKAILATKLSG